VEGDTDIFPWGVATYASRAAVIAGNAVASAAADVRNLVLGIASNMLEVASEDLELAEGRVFVRGAPSRGLTLRQVALAANPLRYAFDPELVKIASFAPARPVPGLFKMDQPGLEARAYFSPPRATWACGAHAAVVEVDPTIGELRYLRYAAVHDCGRVINPMVVEGQIQGGIAQGIGGSFYEQLSYDEDGQLRNASFMDYLIPYAADLPRIDIGHLESLSPWNPLGIKGAGEAGVIPGAAVTASAVDDALGHDVAVRSMPLSPALLHALIVDSGAARLSENDASLASPKEAPTDRDL
jgi:CO/xanthine dehydrogenase Mo-binding subunit